MEPRHGDEHPHTPGPSIWPVGFAVGIACVLAGLVVSPIAVIVGAAIAVVFGALWARDAMRAGRHAAEEAAAPAAAAPPPVATVAELDYAAETDGEVNRYPRNKFLELTTLGLGAVITGIVATPIVGFAILPAFTNQESAGSDLGPTDNFPEGEWIEAHYLHNPAQGEVSRRTLFVRYNGIFEEQPSYTLISNRCVHLGCPVAASGPRNEEESQRVEVEANEVTLTPILPANYSCPCHGGAYDTEGNRTAGPPVRALDRYKYSIIDGHLVLVETYAVAEVEGEGAQARIKSYGIQGPGEHVDGLSGWMYPLQPQDLR